MVWLLTATPASRGRPLPAGPDAYTEHDFRRQLLEYHRKVLVEAYRKVGHRDAKWDAAAESFLDAMAQRMTNYGVAWWYVNRSAPDPAETDRRARAAVDEAGCDDALVIRQYATQPLAAAKKWDDARAWLIRANDAFAAGDAAGRPYPPFCAWECLHETRDYLDRDKDPAAYQDNEDRMRRAMLTLVAATAAVPRGDFERRAIWFYLSSEVEGRSAADLAQLVSDLREAAGDEWTVNMVEGAQHYKAAWDARGTSFYRDIPQENRRVYVAEMRQAYGCYARAYELEPKFPEPCVPMIDVSKAGVMPVGEDDRVWFDRAVEAQLDFWPAYDKIYWSLLPKWGGSYEDMLELAIDCARTGRYDTRVPDEFVVGLTAIRNDSLSREYWRRPGVFDQYDEVMRAYASRTPEDGHRRSILTKVAGTAWQCAEYAKGRRALDDIGGKWDRAAFVAVDVLPARTAGGLHAMTGPHADALLAAERQAAAGELQAAAKAYAQLAAKCQPDDPGSRWLSGRAVELAWQDEFQRGDWVDIMPATEALDGWCPLSGKWELIDGALIVTTDDVAGGQLICGSRFGARYEMRGACEVIDPKDAEDPQLGPIFGWSGENDWCALWFYPKTHAAGWRYGAPAPYRQQEGLAVADGPNTFLISLWDGRGRFVINDSSTWPVKRSWPFSYIDEIRVGVGSHLAHPGVKLRFTGLQVRKLTQEPEGR